MHGPPAIFLCGEHRGSTTGPQVLIPYPAGSEIRFAVLFCESHFPCQQTVCGKKGTGATVVSVPRPTLEGEVFGTGLECPVPVPTFETDTAVHHALVSAVVEVEPVAEIRRQALAFPRRRQAVLTVAVLAAELLALLEAEELVVPLEAEDGLCEAALAVTEHHVVHPVGRPQAETEANLLAAVLLEGGRDTSAPAVVPRLEAVVADEAVAQVAQEARAQVELVVEVRQELLLVDVGEIGRAHV